MTSLAEAEFVSSLFQRGNIQQDLVVLARKSVINNSIFGKLFLLFGLPIGIGIL